MSIQSSVSVDREIPKYYGRLYAKRNNLLHVSGFSGWMRMMLGEEVHKRLCIKECELKEKQAQLHPLFPIVNDSSPVTKHRFKQSLSTGRGRSLASGLVSQSGRVRKTFFFSPQCPSPVQLWNELIYRWEFKKKKALRGSAEERDTHL